MAKTKRQRQFSLVHLAQKAAAEALANETAIYGELLPMVHFIRLRDWVVFREGNLFRVGTKLLDAEGLGDLYRRERARADREREERLVAQGQAGKTTGSHNRETGISGPSAGGSRRQRNQKASSGGGASPPG